MKNLGWLKKYFLEAGVFAALGVSMVSTFAQSSDPFEDLDAGQASAPEVPPSAASETAGSSLKNKKKKLTKKSAETPKTETLSKTPEPAKDTLQDDLAPLDDELTNPTNEKVANGSDGSLTSGGENTAPGEDDLNLEDSETAKKTGGVQENPDEGVRDILEPTQGIEEPQGEIVEEAPEEPAQELAKPETPEALKSDEVRSTLDPSDEFARIPLRPPMSEENWKKYAGPVLDKNYRIRKKDTLWAISERMFGNPYLWPKVWQLNAQFGNPHQIDPGIDLQFFLGNPNSAPVLAFRQKDGESEFLPLLNTYQPLSFLEEIEQTIKAQGSSSDPPFKDFLVEDVPEEISTVPYSTVEGRLMFTEGDKFVDEDLDDGDYSIVRLQSLKDPGAPKANFSGYRLKWLGVIRVKNKLATIVSAYAEISHKDLIVAQRFDVPLLSLREEKLGEQASQVSFTALEEGTAAAGVSAYRSLGVRFPSRDEGPQPGSLLTFKNNVGELGTLLIIHRSGRLATGWVVGSTREITTKDKLE